MDSLQCSMQLLFLGFPTHAWRCKAINWSNSTGAVLQNKLDVPQFELHFSSFPVIPRKASCMPSKPKLYLKLGHVQHVLWYMQLVHSMVHQTLPNPLAFPVLGSWGCACLELVRYHMPQPLVVHGSNEDVCRELFPSDAADHDFTCTAKMADLKCS